jgi:hypothetical protein
MLNAQVDSVQIEVPRRLFRAMHWRPLNLLVSALTGVSVSFCPLFLYELGSAKVSFWDWRVLGNFAVIVLVPGVYMRFGAPVLARAWKSPTDARSAANLWFWLLFVVIGVVIWVVTDPFRK